MTLICDSCAQLYRFPDDSTNPNYKPGATDGACHSSKPGTLREPTKAELVLIRENQDLQKMVREQAGMIRKLEDQQGILL